MKVTKMVDLPDEYTCNICNVIKPVSDMCVAHHRKEGIFYLRPRCKDCHNARERGTRREYKRKYLQRWRARNPQLNESYWRDNPRVKEKARIRAAARSNEKHEALLIQGRLNRRGFGISLKEAEELLNKFGRCYPTRYGLTPEGLRECERIRGAMRRRGSKQMRPVEIRIMAYEDGLYIKPSRQIVPYKCAAKRLRKWQKQRKAAVTFNDKLSQLPRIKEEKRDIKRRAA